MLVLAYIALSLVTIETRECVLGSDAEQELSGVWNGLCLEEFNVDL